MALSKGGKTGHNVSKLDDARRKRAKSKPSPKPEATKNDKTEPATPPQSIDAEADKPPAAAKPARKPKKVSNRRFDKVKVARLKSEIANGDYEINYLNVADKFIEHERYA